MAVSRYNLGTSYTILPLCAVFEVPTLQPGQSYNGPNDADKGDLCKCNTVVYNLVSACDACQGESWIPCVCSRMNSNQSTYLFYQLFYLVVQLHHQSKSWNVGAKLVLLVHMLNSPPSFPEPVPDGTRVPKWAYIDTSVGPFLLCFIYFPRNAHEKYPYRPLTTGTSRRRNPQEVRESDAAHIYIHLTFSSRFPRGYGNGFRYQCAHCIGVQPIAKQFERRRTCGGHCRRYRCYGRDFWARGVVHRPPSARSLCSISRIYEWPRGRHGAPSALSADETLRQCLFVLPQQ